MLRSHSCLPWVCEGEGLELVSRDPTVQKAGKGCVKEEILKRSSVKLFSISVALVTCDE